MQLAQLNIALARAPLDSPLLSEFVALLDPVNAVADAAPGFVWRLQAQDGNATSIRAFDDQCMIVNLSVWEGIEQLRAFVYGGAHLEVMRRRREWFERIRVHMVLWWVPADHPPSVGEAQARLAHLERHGPTPYAFTFKARFRVGDRLTIDDAVGCPA